MGEGSCSRKCRTIWKSRKSCKSGILCLVVAHWLRRIVSRGICPIAHMSVQCSRHGHDREQTDLFTQRRNLLVQRFFLGCMIAIDSRSRLLDEPGIKESDVELHASEMLGLFSVDHSSRCRRGWRGWHRWCGGRSRLSITYIFPTPLYIFVSIGIVPNSRTVS